MTKRVLSSARLGLALAAACVAGSARAQLPTSDQAAGYVVFPKVVVDVSGTLPSHQGRRFDTLIQLTNTDPANIHIAHCEYIDATPVCTGSPNPDGSACPRIGCTACTSNSDCSKFGPLSTCDETAWSGGPDFDVVMNPNSAARNLKPDGWSASNGSIGDLSAPAGIPQVPESPFIGELICVEVAQNGLGVDTPISANDLKGEATIFELVNGALGSVDARSYNGVGFQAQVLNANCISSDNGGTPYTCCTGPGTGNCDGISTFQTGSTALCLGGTDGSTDCNLAYYAGCPAQLVLNHWFDGATDTFTGSTVSTDVTLVPCSTDTALADVNTPMATTTVQILVTNEFEQRFSTVTKVTCFKETQLSDLDAQGGQSSIFSFAVEGTLVGETRFRAVATNETEVGHGLIGIAEEFFTQPGSSPPAPMSSAFNLNYVGLRLRGDKTHQGDFVRLEGLP